MVTELGTALGMLGPDGPAGAVSKRPVELDVGNDVWERLSRLQASSQFSEEFAAAWANGRAFLEASDALRQRRPLIIEWTGGRRPVGDDSVPVDLRIDHVYLVSCKYLSRTIANASPARLFDGLLTTTERWESGDWYQEVAAEAYLELYEACRRSSGLELPDDPSAMSAEERQSLRHALPGRSYPESARQAYRRLCREVSTRSAQRWAANIDGVAARERLVWRLLRIGNAPYFVLGADPRRPLRLRVASPWDWRQAFQLLDLVIRPAEAGQPQVDWTVRYRRRADGTSGEVLGHVEIRWSHGRFAQPPEAKVYIDTPVDRLPGYFPIAEEAGQQALWTDD